MFPLELRPHPGGPVTSVIGRILLLSGLAPLLPGCHSEKPSAGPPVPAAIAVDTPPAHPSAAKESIGGRQSPAEPLSAQERPPVKPKAAEPPAYVEIPLGFRANALAFSPNGQVLAIAGPDVHLWDLRTRRELAILKAHSKYGVSSVAFAPDGKTLASGGDDHTVRLWEMRGGQPTERATLQGYKSSVTAVAFHPDGKTLAASSSADGTIIKGTVWLWDVSTAKAEKRAELPQEGAVNSIAFSPDGKSLAAAGWFGKIGLWDLHGDTPRRRAILDGHRKQVASLAFAPDGKTLASGSEDWTVRLWDVANDVPKEPHVLNAHTWEVSSVAFAPDGRILATAGGAYDLGLRTTIRNTILLWNVEGAAPVGCGRLHHGENHFSPVISLAFSPDGKTLASGSFDGTLRLWRLTESGL
jgi:WD40 repeat protein